MGDSGNRLFERKRVSDCPPIKMSNTGNKWLGVAFHNRLSALALSEVRDAPLRVLFGYFFLATQEKVSRLSGETDQYKKHYKQCAACIIFSYKTKSINTTLPGFRPVAHE